MSNEDVFLVTMDMTIPFSRPIPNKGDIIEKIDPETKMKIMAKVQSVNNMKWNCVKGRIAGLNVRVSMEYKVIKPKGT